MKKVELIFGAIAIIGLILKILDITGGLLLTSISCLLLSIFYYLGFAYFNNISIKRIFKNESYNDTNAKKIIGAVVVGFVLSVIIMGSLFKMMLWPGGNQLLIIGLFSIGIILSISIVFYNRNKSKYFTNIFKRIAVYGALGLILLLTPTDLLIDINYHHYPEYAELLKKVHKDPNNKNLKIQLQQKELEIYNIDQ